MVEIEKHYSTAEVAEQLGVTPRAVQKYIDLGKTTKGREGIWPVVKISHKCLRIPVSAVTRFLRSRTVTAA